MTWAPDALRNYFEVAIDAEQALLLQQSAVVTDIGICLEILTAKLSLYDKDQAILTCLKDELKSLKDACVSRHVDLDFEAMANLRSMAPPYNLSFREQYQNLYWEIRPHLAQHREAKVAGHKFLDDPLALREYRLGKISARVR